MERDELFGSVIRERVSAQKAAARAAIKAAASKEAKAQAQKRHAERIAACKALDERTATVRTKVEELTAGKSTWDYQENGETVAKKTGMFVVLEPAPKRRAITPHHTAVCVVSYVHPTERDYGDNRNSDHDYAQFRFAFIPNELVAAATQANGYPLGIEGLDGIITKDEDTNPPTELFFTQGEYHSKLYDNGRMTGKRDYKSHLRSSTRSVEAWEHSLEWITTAAANPELNPHLQQPLVQEQVPTASA